MSLSFVATDGSTTRARRPLAALALWLSACAPELVPPARRPAPPPRPSVAVLGFAEAPGLATLVAESLRADLAGDEGLRLVPVMKALDRPRPTPGRPHAELPRLPEAARHYATGLELLRAHEPRRAQQLLQRAALLTPGHPLVHAALAGAWEQLGYDRRAGEEAERAHQLAGGLPREDRMLLEALWRRRRHDHARATLIYQGLQRLFPDQPEHAVEAVRAQIAAGQRRQAILAIEQLRAAGAGDPRLDLAEAEAAHGLGNYARAETAAVGAALEQIEGLRREATRRGLLVAVADDARDAGFLALARRAEHEAGPEQP